jgi:hypothetical protein
VSSQDWKRATLWAAHARRARRSGPSKGNGSSSKGGQRVEIVDVGGVAAGDFGLFVLRHALENLRQDLA